MLDPKQLEIRNYKDNTNTRKNLTKVKVINLKIRTINKPLTMLI